MPLVALTADTQLALPVGVPAIRLIAGVSLRRNPEARASIMRTVVVARGDRAAT